MVVLIIEASVDEEEVEEGEENPIIRQLGIGFGFATLFALIWFGFYSFGRKKTKEPDCATHLSTITFPIIYIVSTGLIALLFAEVGELDSQKYLQDYREE